MQRPGIGIHAVLDGVLHDGLQGQWRQAKACEGRIEINNKHIVKLRLFYSQIGAGVFQFCGKGNGVVTGDGVEISAQVIGEILRDLPSFLGVKSAKAVDAHQGVVDEVRTHLQHHDAGTFMGDLPLLPSDLPLLPSDFPLLSGDLLLVAKVLITSGSNPLCR
jgi:hypothetical protein